MIATKLSTANMGPTQIHGINTTWTVVVNSVASWNLLCFGNQGRVNYAIGYRLRLL